jgi:hypothetical protein
MEKPKGEASAPCQHKKTPAGIRGGLSSGGIYEKRRTITVILIGMGETFLRKAFSISVSKHTSCIGRNR